MSPNRSDCAMRRYCRCNKMKIKFYHNWNPLWKVVCSQVRLNNLSKRSNSQFSRKGTGPELLCCQRRRYQIQVVEIEIVILPSSCSQIWLCCKKKEHCWNENIITLIFLLLLIIFLIINSWYLDQTKVGLFILEWNCMFLPERNIYPYFFCLPSLI